MERADRPIVLLAVEHDYTNIVHNALCRKFEIAESIIEQPVSRWKLLRGRAKRMGWWSVVGQILFMLTIVRWLRWNSKRRADELKRELGLDSTPIPSVRRFDVESVNEARVVERLKELNPSVVIVNGTRIISRRVLGAVDGAVFLNAHAGITPLYRGTHGGYWSLAMDDSENCGVTVHRVDAGIDTGGILRQARVTPGPRDNFLTYPLHQLAAGLRMLPETIREARAGELKEIEPPYGESRLWVHPTIWQYLYFYFRRGVK